MDFLATLVFSPKKKKTAEYTQEYKKFKAALHRNSLDYGLQAQFVKFCLVGHFTLEDAPKEHLTEGLAHYEKVAKGDYYDPHVFYLAGRYYQDKDKLKAQNAYLEGVKHFNHFVAKNPGMKADYAELAYATALNFLTLQFGQIHPELEKFFKTIRKSYPLLNKRAELESEMAKPSPNQARVKQITQELRELKDIIGKSKAKKASEE